MITTLAHIASQDTPSVILCSLHDIQGQRYLTDKEFAHFLGIDEKTLRRLRDPEQRQRISVITKRRIAAKLGRPPHTIVELLWTPSQTYLAAVDTLFDQPETTEIIEADADTGRPTGRRLRLHELDGQA